MALRWIEGWEAAAFPTTLDRYYRNVDIGAASVSASLNQGATLASSHCLTVGGSGFLETPQIVPTVQSSFVIGLAFRSGQSAGLQQGGVDPAHISFINTDGEQCRIEFFDDNPSPLPPGGAVYRIRLMRGVTELCASTQAFSVVSENSEWIYFEFKVTIDNSTGSIVGRFSYIQKPRRNPSGSYTTLAWDAANTSLDTQDQTSAGALSVGFQLSNCRTDDIYICDGTGAKNNDYLGKIVVAGQKPNTDGATAEFDLAGSASDLFNAWNEGVTIDPTSGADDRRLSTDATGEIHLATMSALSGVSSGAVVVGLRQDLTWRMETTGDLDIAHRYRKTTGTPAETDGGVVNLDSTATTSHADITEDDPNTATAWVLADLSSYQHGAANRG